ncbi:hypothetical protein LO772_21425 [Yinghuangia sp. ASG 101]|uniref:hypothetical protein n=1 Tax=Yinghuangia sp. ASG 101 TaxID=2896848 RepID=UPI001E354267|nr:hypothetical protein [Yinghuangia sp. ASG 101]UGQ09496.1 hypothetical protein LO772_21425 [Yinghuangia sp. ASG 101]
MVKPTKRIAGGLLASAFAVGSALAFAPSAYAGEVTANVKCSLPAGAGEAEGMQKITVEAPSSAAAGAEVDVKVTLGESPAKSPLALDGVELTPSIDFKVGNDTVTVTGTASTINVKANESITAPPFNGKFKVPAGASGSIDLIPVKLGNAVNVPGIGALTADCTVNGAGKVASISVSGGGTTGSSTGSSTSGTTGGTTSGTTGSTTSGTTGSTTSGTTGSTSSGGSGTSSGTTGTSGSGSSTGSSGATTGGSLPKTGPLDDAVSMGLVGGTVGLLGIGAVLVATRKVRSRNNTA